MVKFLNCGSRLDRLNVVLVLVKNQSLTLSSKQTRKPSGLIVKPLASWWLNQVVVSLASWDKNCGRFIGVLLFDSSYLTRRGTMTHTPLPHFPPTVYWVEIWSRQGMEEGMLRLHGHTSGWGKEVRRGHMNYFPIRCAQFPCRTLLKWP